MKCPKCGSENVQYATMTSGGGFSAGDLCLGYLPAVPAFFLLGASWRAAAAGMAVMFADWLLQRLGVAESTNLRRLLTGILGGYGIMTAHYGPRDQDLRRRAGVPPHRDDRRPHHL